MKINEDLLGFNIDNLLNEVDSHDATLNNLTNRYFRAIRDLNIENSPSGIYYINGWDSYVRENGHAPSMYDWMFCIHFNTSGTEKYQVCFCCNTPHIYTRRYNGTNWTEWSKLI